MFDAQTDISSMYGVQWVAGRPTRMGIDCAVKLAELALLADRVFLQVPRSESPSVDEDDTMPSVVRGILHTDRNTSGFLFDARTAMQDEERAGAWSKPLNVLDNHRLVSGWIASWIDAVCSTTALVQSASDWIARQPSAYEALRQRAGQKTQFHSWDSEAGDSPDDTLAKKLAIEYGCYARLANSRLGALFQGSEPESATNEDRALYIVLITILMRTITYAERAAYIGQVWHPHPLRMPILAAISDIDPPAPNEPPAMIWRFLRPTDNSAAGLGCSLPLMLPMVTRRLEDLRRDLSPLLYSPEQEERHEGEAQFIYRFCEDLIELHGTPASCRLRSELAEIEETGSITGLRDQLRHLNKYVSEILKLDPIDVAIEVAESAPGVSIKSLGTPFRVIFAGAQVELDALQGNVQRLAFLRRTKLSGECIMTLRTLARDKESGVDYRLGGGSYVR